MTAATWNLGIGALSALAVLSLPLIAGGPREGAPVLVLGAPGTGSAALVGIVAQADGALVRGTRLPWIMLARSERPDFAARLRASGAWLVLDASDLTGCLPSQPPLRPGDPT